MAPPRARQADARPSEGCERCPVQMDVDLLAIPKLDVTAALLTVPALRLKVMGRFCRRSRRAPSWEERMRSRK